MANLVEVFIDLASTLGEMARMDICHRDLKPQNILMGEKDVPKIVDLNSVSFPNGKALTFPAASAIPGTPAYFSPQLAAAVLAEMKTGERAAYKYAPADDLYALGCVFYEVLVGHVPCCDPSASLVTNLRQIVKDKPPYPSELDRAIPFSVSKVVMRLLAKNPAERYQSGHDAANELKTAREQTVEDNWFEPFIVRRAVPRRKHQSWLAPAKAIVQGTRSRRRRAARLALTATAAVAAVVIGAVLWQDCPPESSAEKGPTVRCKAKMALTTAFAALSCAGLTKSVQAQDEEWLAQCPAEARKTPKKLRMYSLQIASFPRDGPNVRWHRYGYELRAGPVEVYLSTLDRFGGGSLLGEIRIGSDSASVRFTKIKLDRGDELPVCGIGYGGGARPQGFRKRQKGEPQMDPDSELHPEEGFIYVDRRTLEIELAHEPETAAESGSGQGSSTF